jgi:Icc-related predicted phosphoesterase
MSVQTKIYFVTDIHGSERCFRKFLNAGPLYKADVMIMGGDLAGKELLVISEKAGGSSYSFIVNGKSFEIETNEELKEAKQFISDLGFYSYVGQSEDIQAMQAEQTFEAFMETLMRERMLKWLEMAEQKLSTSKMPLYWMLGNDDPQSWASYLRDCPWGTYSEDGIIKIDDYHEMISWGYSNPTPWQTAREQSEEQLLVTLDFMTSNVSHHFLRSWLDQKVAVMTIFDTQ